MHDREPSATEPVSVDFELTPEEWVEVSMEHGSRSVMNREALRKVRYLMVLIFALLALIFLMSGSGWISVIWVLAGLLAAAMIRPILVEEQRKQLLRYARSGIANGMFGRHRVTLRPEGMLDSTDGYDWLTRWHAIDRVEEGSGAFLIYTGQNSLLPVPHSAFRDAPALRRFSDTFFALRETATAGPLPAGSAPAPGDVPAARG